MDPEEAVRAHGDLGGRVLVPVHWATFNLAFHRWAEPAQRLVAAAERSEVPVIVPLPGQRMDVLNPPELEDWWTAVGSATDAERPPVPRRRRTVTRRRARPVRRG
jgi:hypothetical protein